MIEHHRPTSLTNDVTYPLARYPEIYLHTDLSDLARQVNKAHQHVEKLLAQMEEGEDHDRQF